MNAFCVRVVALHAHLIGGMVTNIWDLLCLCRSVSPKSYCVVYFLPSKLATNKSKFIFILSRHTVGLLTHEMSQLLLVWTN